MTDVDKNNELEFAAAISQNTSYSTYFNDNFSISGTPKQYNLERCMNNPQSNIDEICEMSKYYYYSSGVIMRVINIMRDFGSVGLRKDYGSAGKKVKKIIEEYDKKIGIKELVKDIFFEKALTGNAALYDRDGQRVDIYPLSLINVSDLIINGKQQLRFDHTKFNRAYEDIEPNERELIKQAYPEEVRNSTKVMGYTNLNIENTYFLKHNSSRYEKYGVPFILPAFPDLAQKNLMKEAEKSTAAGIVDQMLHIIVGDKDNKPSEAAILFYDKMFQNKKGSVRVTTPHFVNFEWISPETDIFGEEKFLEVDKDILSSLGVSLTLLRGDGGGNYSDGIINMSGLIRTIDSIREGIPEVIEDLYRKELIRNGIGADKVPKVSFDEVEINKDTRQQLLQWLFQSAGLPYEVLYEGLGYDFESVKDTRDNENKEAIEDVFKLRAMPFQGNEEKQKEEAGRPELSESERTTDRNYSNNDQPRSGLKKEG